MNKPPSYHNPEFDEFAEDYDKALEEGIAVSGEHKEYFAQGRVNWLGRCLATDDFTPTRIRAFNPKARAKAIALLASKFDFGQFRKESKSAFQ